MSDKQGVVSIALLVTFALVGGYWLAAQRWPGLMEDGAIGVALPVMVAIAVLSPIAIRKRK